jgi:hypothetical protein
LVGQPNNAAIDQQLVDDALIPQRNAARRHQFQEQKGKSRELQIGWIFLNCYLYSALIDANNLLVPAATPSSALGSVVGASVMGYVLDHGGMIGSLVLTVGSMLLTAALTMPFLRSRVKALAA